MDRIPELLSLLVTDPRGAMYQAREEDCRPATLALAGLAVVLAGVLGLIRTGSILGFILGGLASLVSFLIFAGVIFLAGSFTGGTGGFMDIVQLTGLIWIPVGLVQAVTGMAGVGFIGTVVGWVALYFVIMVGHNFSTFADMKLAVAVAVVLNFLSTFAVAALLVGVARILS